MKRAVLVLCLIAAGSARADVNVQARGSATVTGGDAAAAKARALDDALRQAVDQAASSLIAPEQREALADLVKKRILRKARSYVLRYKVTAEGEEEGVYAMTVDATIADGPLGTDVRALAGVGKPPAGTTTPPATAPAPRLERPQLTVLAVTRMGDQVWSSFGRSAAEPGPVTPALERELGARGFRVARAAGLEVPVGVEAGGDEGLPLAPAQAVEIAKKAGAGGALVAAALVKDGGPIRGTRRVGSEIELRVRLDDAADGSKLAEGQVTAAGHGSDAAGAAADAGRAAAEQAGRLVGKRLDSHWPGGEGPVGEDGVVVRLRGVARGSDVELFVKAMTGGPGVRAVVLERLARREVTLLVRGATPPRVVADLAAGTMVPGSRVQARVGDGGVEVDVASEPLRSAPP